VTHSSSNPNPSAEAGFTLIELVVVILILGILIAVAVPSYLLMQDRANKSAASSNVRAAVSDLEAYYSDNGTFRNISATVLQSRYDASLDIGSLQIVAASKNGGTNNSYMICSYQNGWYAWKEGPDETVKTGKATASDFPSTCTLP
jgi:type IV pilus assembly protein PilA